MLYKPLYLVTDMYGCPNRCRHCWLGHMPNRVMEPGADAWLVDYFRPDFETVVFYSWLREPDFCDSYRARWERDNALSVGGAELLVCYVLGLPLLSLLERMKIFPENMEKIRKTA